MTAFLCRFSGMPPNLVTSGFLPGRSTVAWKKQPSRPAGSSGIYQLSRRAAGGGLMLLELAAQPQGTTSRVREEHEIRILFNLDPQRSAGLTAYHTVRKAVPAPGPGTSAVAVVAGG
jgi:hypothetical protein